MKPELEEALFRDFPNLYKNLAYFECDDGWEPLIRRLSEKLETMIKALDYPYEGKVQLLATDPPDWIFPYAQQVKEKFGGLRFYMSSGTDEMYEAINQAESESYLTCEACGAPGESRSGGWIKTLCDECEAKSGRRR